MKNIDRKHKQRSFKIVGYHFIILLDGTIEQGRPLDMIGDHYTNHNAHSIGICHTGGLDKSGKPKDTRTQVQKDVLWSIMKSLQEQYSQATLHGHNEFANKACLCLKLTICNYYNDNLD